ncbi:methyl-accepting chemotaxis protein [Aeromonas molluscorum 848]|uniref:Methyl-accepting chemotaxis protein n=2 Tax=Aeromonas molluscorum TaxID=271417 RepID=R1H182_9GAMM|nr:methyl-accepting chemotaxis protein [Aeromonas molluscorum 848]
MNIGKKLSVAFATFGLMMVAIGGFSLLQFDRINSRSLELTDAIIPSINRVNNMGQTVANLRRFELSYLLVDENPARQAEYGNQMRSEISKITGLLAQYGKTLFDAEETRRYQAVSANWQRYLALHDAVMAQLARGEHAAGTEQFLAGAPTYVALHDAVDQLIAQNQYYAKLGREESQSAYESARTSIFITLTIGILLVIAFATLLTRQIRDPIVLLAKQAKLIAGGYLGRGELCDYIDAGKLNRDEIGELALSVRQMKEGLSDLVNEISTSVTQLSASVDEVSAISEQSAQGMRQQQSEITQVATAMNQMQSTVLEVSRNTTDAANAAQHASQASSAGQAVVQSAIGSIEGVAGKIDEAGQVVQQLEQESANISLVLDVIRNIADQTNLLALNAAIEAARTGDQGRGFAVVADEVRTLAKRTQDSTAEIHKMIESLQSRAELAGQAMNSSHAQMQTSVELAQDAGQSIARINEAVTRITDMNTQIASATEQQNSVTAELNRNIVNIHNVSDENAQGAQHTAQACTELSQLASHLQQLTRRFTL